MHLHFLCLLIPNLSYPLVTAHIGAMFQCKDLGYNPKGGTTHAAIKIAKASECSKHLGALHAMLDECPAQYQKMTCGLQTGVSSYIDCDPQKSPLTAVALNAMAVRLDMPDPKLQCVLGVIASTDNCTRSMVVLEQIITQVHRNPSLYRQCQTWTQTSTMTSTASSTASTTASATATTSATTTATSRPVYAQLKCVGLYNQKYCMLAADDGVWETCAEQAHFLSGVLESCGHGKNLFSCSLIDGQDILVVTPTTAPAGTVQGAANFGSGARPGAVAYLLTNYKHQQDAQDNIYAYWTTGSGDARTLCPKAAMGLSGAIAQLRKWGKPLTVKLECALGGNIYAGILSGSQVGHLNALINAYMELDFVGCRAETSTATSSATSTLSSTDSTTATTSPTTTGSTVLLYAQFKCEKILQMDVLATRRGPGSCLADVATLSSIILTCTKATAKPELSCQNRGGSIVVAAPTDSCEQMAAALTKFVNAPGMVVQCVSTGITAGPQNKQQAIFRLSGSNKASECTKTVPKLNRQLVSYTESGICTASTTTTTSTSTTTSLSTVTTTSTSTTTDAKIYPSLSLEFAMDAKTVVPVTFAASFCGRAKSAIHLLNEIGTFDIVRCKVYDTSDQHIISVISFQNRVARDAILNRLAAQQLSVYYDGTLYLGSVNQNTPKPARTTQPTTTVDPSCGLRVYTALNSDKFTCTDLLARMAGKATTTAARFTSTTQVQLEFDANIDGILGNDVLDAATNAQFQTYLAEVSGGVVAAADITFKDSTPSAFSDPSGCRCLLAVQMSSFSGRWVDCPAMATGLAVPSALSDYLGACPTLVRTGMHGPQMTVTVTAKPYQVSILTDLAKDCVLCVTLDVGTKQNLCAHLAGRPSCVESTSVPTTLTNTSATTTAQAPNTTTTTTVTSTAVTAATAVPATSTSEDIGELYIGLLVGTAVLLLVMACIAFYFVASAPVAKEQPQSMAMGPGAGLPMSREQEMTALLARLKKHLAVNSNPGTPRVDMRGMGNSPQYDSPSSMLSTPVLATGGAAGEKDTTMGNSPGIQAEEAVNDNAGGGTSDNKGSGTDDNEGSAPRSSMADLWSTGDNEGGTSDNEGNETNEANSAHTGGVMDMAAAFSLRQTVADGTVNWLVAGTDEAQLRRRSQDRATDVTPDGRGGGRGGNATLYIAMRAAHLAIDESELNAGLASVFSGCDGEVGGPLALTAATLCLLDRVKKYDLIKQADREKLLKVLRANALDDIALGRAANRTVDDLLQNIVADENGNITYEVFINACVPEDGADATGNVQAVSPHNGIHFLFGGDIWP